MAVRMIDGAMRLVAALGGLFFALLGLVLVVDFRFWNNVYTVIGQKVGNHQPAWLLITAMIILAGITAYRCFRFARYGVAGP